MIPKRGTVKRALITGASRGIAKRFGADGYDVVATNLEYQVGKLKCPATEIRAGFEFKDRV